MNAIFPARMPTFRMASSPDSGSITRPLRMAMSKDSSAEALAGTFETKAATQASKQSATTAFSAFSLCMNLPVSFLTHS